uniref:Major facilitator superfamily (MFS) profile domain-containing protein n=1 Tax=Hucho hucho TaxID=62062 RepID=A0A4W5M775_9TELE
QYDGCVVPWCLYLRTIVCTDERGTFRHNNILHVCLWHIQSFVNQTWLGSGSFPVTHGRKKALLFNIDAVLMVFSRLAMSLEVILLNIFLYGYNVVNLHGKLIAIHLITLQDILDSPKMLRGFLTLTSSIFIGFRKVMVRLSVPLLLNHLTRVLWSVYPSVVSCSSLVKHTDLGFVLTVQRSLSMVDQMDDMGKERVHMQGQKVKNMWDVLTSHCVRWQVLILVIPCAGIQFCGNNAVSLYFYTFDIFREAGVAEDKLHYLSSGIGTTDLITICSLLIDRAGRKMLMGYGYQLMEVSMPVLIDLYSWFLYVNITLIFSVICIYGLGPSGFSMALPADLFLQAWRPSAKVISGFVNWLGLFLIGMFFPYIVNGLGQFCFLIFVAYCILSKSTVEIMEDFNKLRGTDTKKGCVISTTF